MDYADILHKIADAHEADSDNAWVETAALREASAHIVKLTKALELYERERTRFRHTHPEITGAYFISGESGPKDANMLPASISICPAYGCDWSVRYDKTESVSLPES
jgi:hypothetical protein